LEQEAGELGEVPLPIFSQQCSYEQTPTSNTWFEGERGTIHLSREDILCCSIGKVFHFLRMNEEWKVCFDMTLMALMRLMELQKSMI
jgi:hypothetical protein